MSKRYVQVLGGMKYQIFHCFGIKNNESVAIVEDNTGSISSVIPENIRFIKKTDDNYDEARKWYAE